MRIRLSVQRNGLPAADIVWSIPQNQTDKLSGTIASFLETVNEVIPLEAVDWGLEDYVVQIAGFACMHFQRIEHVFKEDDHVVIRPLETPEIRARVFSGRYQISAAGQHLVDGIPFGKAQIRRPPRPAISIPPRKRRRLEQGDDREAERLTDMVDNTANRSMDNDLEETPETDDDYSAEGWENRQRIMAMEHRDSRASSTRSVHFEEPEENQRALALMDAEDEEEEDDEFDPDDDARTSDSDSSSEESEDESEAESEEVTGNAVMTNGIHMESDGESDDESDSESSGGSSSDSSSEGSSSAESGSEEESDSEPEVVSSKKPGPTTRIAGMTTAQMTHASRSAAEMQAKGKKSSGTLSPKYPQLPRPDAKEKGKPPHTGKRRTFERNQRRRDATRLNNLKQRGTLPSTANRADLMKYLDRHQSFASEDSSDESSVEDEAAAGAEDMHVVNSGRPDGSPTNTSSAKEPRSVAEMAKLAFDAGSIEQRRQQLLDAIALGGVDTDVPGNDGSATQSSSKRKVYANRAVAEDSRTQFGRHKADEMSTLGEEPTVAKSSSLTLEVMKSGETSRKRKSLETAQTHEDTPTKRARLDIAGSRRLLFGSLGVRTPKTRADEDKLRIKLAEAGKKPVKSATKPNVTFKEPESESERIPDDSDVWRSKIVLTAVECCDEGVLLTEPPYPFVQRWDPQQKRKNYAQDKGARKWKRKAAEKYGYDDTYGNEGEMYQDYEGGMALNYDDVEDGAESQLLNEVEAAKQVEDLPSLPEDMAALPDLTKDQAKQGAVIAFKQLEVSQATNWTPTLSAYRTASVHGVDGNTLHLYLAIRDREQKDVKFDGKGKRLYDRFEMERSGDEEEEEDDGFRGLDFCEMVDAKLISEAPEERVEERIATGVEVRSPDLSSPKNDEGEETIWNGIEEPEKSSSFTEQWWSGES